MLQFTLLIFIPAALAANTECPDNWTSIPGSNGFCYVYLTDQTWNEANEECQKLEGGDLASIDDEAEGTAIYNYWTSIEEDGPSGYWIGLSDIHGTGFGTRKWTDWTNLRGRTNYQDGQPSDNLSDDCVYVANQGDTGEERQQWRATSCNDVRKPAFCERKAVISK